MMAAATARAMGVPTPREARLAKQVQVLKSRNRDISARYDAAQTTPDNRKHWGSADALSANSSASPGVRRTLRQRSRYEVANNCYAFGISHTVANDTVGTGPRVQIRIPKNERDNAIVEALFAEWADDIDLAEKLRTARIGKIQDGESFGILTSNPGLLTDVQLDLRLVEADQVTNPSVGGLSQKVEGITYDQWGNPSTYQILTEHPGEHRITEILKTEDYAAKDVLHYFTPTRAGQPRGIPEITPALPLFAQLRRYTLAVLAAAEVAADFAMVLQTDGAADDTAIEGEPFDEIELVSRMATTLPPGWKLGQAKPEQPTTTYGGFKGEILNEIARCLSVPFNVAAGNSSGYNYSSGRLDHQTYFKAVHVERSRMRRTMLKPIFRAWLNEAIHINGYLPPSVVQAFREMRMVPHQWFWDGQEHVDPAKEATAQKIRLENRTTTLARELARQGLDWQAELRQLAEEETFLRSLGLQVIPDKKQTPPGGEEEEEPDDGEEDE